MNASLTLDTALLSGQTKRKLHSSSSSLNRGEKLLRIPVSRNLSSVMWQDTFGHFIRKALPRLQICVKRSGTRYDFCTHDHSTCSLTSYEKVKKQHANINFLKDLSGFVWDDEKGMGMTTEM